jgi:hypothetical protein
VEAHALKLALAGATFGDICRLYAAKSAEENAVAEAGAMLGQWLRDGFVVGFAGD